MINHFGSLADSSVAAAVAHAQTDPRKWSVYLIEENGAKRSEAQNKLYRRLVQKFAQQQGRTVSYWHEYLVIRFLGFDEITTPDGDLRKVLVSTTDLCVSDFTSFLNACMSLAAEMQIR